MSSFDFNKDGVDHINAYSQSISWLGLRLSNFDYSPINHPEDGRFNSLEGYWYFLISGNEELRNLHGHEAKNFGKSEKKENDFKIDSVFKRKFYKALVEKIYSNEKLKEELRKCNLPIVHYYTRRDSDGKKFSVQLNKHLWVWDQVNAIRLDLQGVDHDIDLFKEAEETEKTKEDEGQLSFF